VSGVHAVAPPSFLDTIVHCHGSLALSRANPQPETQQTKEGEVAHKVAMLFAMAATNPNVSVLPQLGNIIDGVRVDAEMIAGAKLYAEALEGFAGNPEQRIDIWRMSPEEPAAVDPETGEAIPVVFGTPDFWQYAENTKTLRITDYKFGHLYVDVFENWQLIAYACGIIDMLVAQHRAFEFEMIVEFMIVQPRCYSADTPVRTWTTSAANLRAYINQAKVAVEDALAPNPKTKAGTHCLFCPARGFCKTAHVASTAILEYAGTVEAMSQNPHEIGLRLNLINAALTMLKGVATGLEEQAMQMIQHGKVVPWFRLGHSQPREIWSKPAEEIAALGALTGKTLTKLDYALTPKQAVKAGIPRAVVDQYATTPHGKARLESDDLTNAARIFNK
jgi:hypothetical protein